MENRRCHPAQSVDADHQRWQVLQATELGARQGEKGGQMKGQKSEMRNPKFEIAATDEPRMKHGSQSVFHPCFIRGVMIVFLLLSLFGCQKSGSARNVQSLPPTFTTKGGVEMVQIVGERVKPGNEIPDLFSMRGRAGPRRERRTSGCACSGANSRQRRNRADGGGRSYDPA